MSPLYQPWRAALAIGSEHQQRVGNMKAWYGDDTCGLQLYVLSDEAIYMGAEPKEGAGKEIEQAIQGGLSPVKVLPKDIETISLSSIKRISADVVRNEIEITYNRGKDENDEAMLFRNERSFFEAYQQLKTACQNRFSEAADDHTIPRAAYGSLWALTIFGFLTWVFYSMAQDVASNGISASGSKQKLLARVVDLLGTVGVLAIGGIVLLGTAAYLISRVRNPPKYLILQEGCYKASGSIRVSVNYAVLLVAWLFLLKVFL